MGYTGSEFFDEPTPTSRSEEKCGFGCKYPENILCVIIIPDMNRELKYLGLIDRQKIVMSCCNTSCCVRNTDTFGRIIMASASLVGMYGSREFFERYLGMDASRSIAYSAFIAVLLLLIVMAIRVWILVRCRPDQANTHTCTMRQCATSKANAGKTSCPLVRKKREILASSLEQDASTAIQAEDSASYASDPSSSAPKNKRSRKKGTDQEKTYRSTNHRKGASQIPENEEKKKSRRPANAGRTRL